MRKKEPIFFSPDHPSNRDGFDCKSPNCIGHALHGSGIIRRDRFVYPPAMKEAREVYQITNNRKKADAVGVIDESKPNGGRLVHLANFDPADPNREFVIHRPKYGRSPIRALASSIVADGSHTYGFDIGGQENREKKVLLRVRRKYRRKKT